MTVLSDLSTALLFACFAGLAPLFAGCETGLYQLSPLRLRLGVERKLPGFRTLGQIIADKPGLLLSLLIGTNLADYLATSVVTWTFYYGFGPAHTAHTAEIAAALITAPSLFVFSELVPKNIFFYRADVVMPALARFMLVCQRVFTWSGMVPVLRIAATFLGKTLGLHGSAETAVDAAQRHKIQVLLQETRDEGLLSPLQTDLIARIMSTPGVQLHQVTTPIEKIPVLRPTADHADLVDALKRWDGPRLPVAGQQPDVILGYVDVDDILSRSEPFQDVRPYVSPILAVDSNALVVDVIARLRADNQRIALVTKTGASGRTRPAGIVTLEDLMEELLVHVT
jgi:putative hemolysin